MTATFVGTGGGGAAANGFGAPESIHTDAAMIAVTTTPVTSRGSLSVRTVPAARSSSRRSASACVAVTGTSRS